MNCGAWHEESFRAKFSLGVRSLRTNSEQCLQLAKVQLSSKQSYLPLETSTVLMSERRIDGIWEPDDGFTLSFQIIGELCQQGP